MSKIANKRKKKTKGKMKMKTEKGIGGGVFCKLYGDTVRNRVLEHFLANYETDFAAPDVAAEKEASKPQTYLIIEDLVKEGILIKSRMVGRTQLYKLNRKNKMSIFLLNNFEKSLKTVFDDDVKENSFHSTGSSRALAMSAKHC